MVKSTLLIARREREMEQWVQKHGHGARGNRECTYSVPASESRARRRPGESDSDSVTVSVSVSETRADAAARRAQRRDNGGTRQAPGITVQHFLASSAAARARVAD